ncbi:MAG: hypothetical protein ACK4F6_19405, partial [Hylemonella sp.]
MQRSTSLRAGNCQQIPVLTGRACRRGGLRPNSLVRLRVMVQDVFDPEYYHAIYAVQTVGSGAQRAWLCAGRA